MTAPPPRFSLIAATRRLAAAGLDWHRAQRAPEVELVIIENPGRCGLGAAWNEGLAAARGQYCCFIHDDVEIQTPGWLQRLAAASEQDGYDLLGVAGTQCLPHSAAWWMGPAGTLRGEIWHRWDQDALQHNCYGPPDDPARGLSPAVSLDGLLLFGRRDQFVTEPFDTEFLDGFHFYDADLCLRWLTRRGRRLGVLHGLRVIHASPGNLEDPRLYPLQTRLLERYGGLLPLDLAGLAIWRRNLETLRLFDPRTAAAVTADRLPGRWRLFERRGAALHALGKTPDGEPLEPPLVDPDQAPEPAAGVELILLGAGDGRRLTQALGAPWHRIQVIEPEGQLLLHLLTRQDLSAPLAAGRLRLALPLREQPALAEIALMEHLAECQSAALRRNPPALAHTGSTALHAAFFAALESAVTRIRSLATAAPACSSEPRWAFDVTVISPCCLIFDDLARALAALGLRVQLYRVPDRPGVWNDADWRAALAFLRAQPAPVTLLRNRSLLETDMSCARLDPERVLPGQLLSWWWDIPNVASVIDLAHAAPPRPALAFAREILTLLPPGSQWLPPGARHGFAAAPPVTDTAEPPEPVISFVGQSRLSSLIANLNMLTDCLRQRLGARGARLAAGLDRQRGFAALHRTLEDRAPALRQAIDRLHPALPHQSYYLEYLLRMCLTGAFRIAAVETLTASGLPLRVYGDDEWLRTGALDPAQFGGIMDPAELPAHYCRVQLNLNLNFMQVASTVNPRVLDIAAAGGAVLTDVRPELDWLYPDPACRPCGFTTLEELPDRAAALLARDLMDQRAALQAHTRAHHRLDQRARWLADWLRLTPSSP